MRVKYKIVDQCRKHNISMIELSNKIGISSGNLYNISNNKTGVAKITTLKRIADGIGCEVSELYEIVND